MSRAAFYAAICCLPLALSCGAESADMVVPGAIEYVSAPTRYNPGGGATLRVAVVALPVSREKDVNLKRIEEMALRITAETQGVQMVHLGEAALGWYYEPAAGEAYQREIAEPIPGPASDRLSELAERAGVYLSWGMIENDGGALFGAVVLASPAGEIIAKHRKMLLYHLDRASGIGQAAPNVQVVDIAGLRVGLMICFDGKSEWLQRELVEREADLVLWSAASQVIDGDVSPTARKLDAWIALANRFGRESDEEYDGSIFIADPSGAVRAAASGGPGYRVFDVVR
jgi:predicted amidohydrolase